MLDDLAFRDARLGWRGLGLLAAAGAAVYGSVAAFGLPALYIIGGLTLGYVVAKATKA